MSVFMPSPKAEQGGAIFSLVLLITFVGIVAAGTAAFIMISHTDPLNPYFLERTPPEIAWVKEPLGLGADPVQAAITISDDGAGIDEVIVRIIQNNQPKEELTRVAIHERGLHSKRIDFTINPKALTLREGKAEIQVLAFDKTLWNNGSRLQKSLEVNFSKPRIEVITPQQNGVAGGSELVFFRVLGKKPYTHGVFSNGTLYPAYQAVGWDPSFKQFEDLYLGFFPIPVSFEDDRDAMTITARDEIGNSASAPFNYKVRQRRWSSFRIQLDEGQAKLLVTTLLTHALSASIKIKPSGDAGTDLALLLKTLARHDESIVSDALSSSAIRRYWQGSFSRPVATYPAHSAGDIRSISVNDVEILKGSSAGVRFPVSLRSPVTASNHGVVVFAGDLGVLGKTIVIDHGLGLATVYGHLSEIGVKNRESVKQGQQIGRTGKSGFAASEEVYFETRVHGVPVSPNEWWDETWVRDHIEAKIAFVQRSLIGTPGE